MPAFASGLGVIQIDSTTGGSLTDISAGTESFSINVDQNVGSYFVMSALWENSLQGGKSWRVDLTIIGEDTSATSAYSILSAWAVSTTAGSRTIQIDQPVSTTGGVRYSGEVVLVNGNNLLNGMGGSGDPVKATVSLRGTGTLTRSIIV